MKDNVWFVVTGIERSGTVWITRLLADALNVPAQTAYRDPPCTYEDDPAVWGSDRQGKCIRRLHAYVDRYPQYPYADVPCVVVMRDPRDLAVSRVDASKYARVTESYDQMAIQLLPIWCDFHQKWDADKRRQRTVCYENMLDWPEQELLLTIVALGETVTRDTLLAAIQTNAFPVMENWIKGEHGCYGTWHEKLSPSVAKWVWDKFGETMARYGYTED